MRSGQEWFGVDINGDPRLVIGWRPSRRVLTGARIELHQDTFIDLRLVASAALHRLAASTPVPYTHEAQPEAGEEYLRRALTHLQRSPRSATSEQTEVADLVQVVGHCDELDVVSANALADGDFAFYAICYPQDDSNETVAFVRALNPTRVLKKAAFVGRFAGSLRRVETPDLVLDSEIDLVLTGDELAILRRSAYDRLFADLDELAAAVPTNIIQLIQAMPLLPMADESLAVLTALGSELSSVARRLELLSGDDGLAEISPASLRAALEHHGEASHEWFNGSDELLLDRARAKNFLDVVEGRWWTSDFQRERRRADRFRKR